jgi:hypothetical protein
MSVLAQKALYLVCPSHSKVHLKYRHLDSYQLKLTWLTLRVARSFGKQVKQGSIALAVEVNFVHAHLLKYVG